MFLIKSIKTLIKNLIFFSDLKIWLKVFRKSHKNNSYNWATSTIDIYVLRKLIKTHNPKNILELGTGIGASTEAIVDQMSNETNLVSLENNSSCINTVKKKLIPYRKNYNIIKTEVKICKKKINIETLIYKISRKLNVSNYDLIYIDGPSFLFNKNKKKFITGLPRGDIFYFYNKIKIGCIVIIDGSLITQKQVFRFCRSIKFLEIFKCFGFTKRYNDNLFDSEYQKLKTWKYL
jgi:hypothetical protein